MRERTGEVVGTRKGSTQPIVCCKYVKIQLNRVERKCEKLTKLRLYN